MSVIGIVCEYNPFHNGHEYQIMMGKRILGEDSPVICVMSGDFVQRGEPAVYSKFARAEAACLCGADLVLELPLPWCISSAEGFARGAVGLLAALGATHLCFGSEAGEVEPLEKLAKVLIKPEINIAVKEILRSEAGLSYAAARERAVAVELGELSEQLKLPNNILAVEYLKSIYEQGLDMIPVTVQRFGSAHDSDSDGPGPKSASEIRSMIINGDIPEGEIPYKALEVYRRERERGREVSCRANFEIAALSRLRMFSEEYFNSLPDAAHGTGTRLYKSCRRECSLDAVLSAAKTKRYALARIRRMCLCACLGIKEGMNKGIPPYARVLAADEKGCALLKAAAEKSAVPILTKPASVRNMSEDCRKLFAAGAAAHDFYSLCYRADCERKGGTDWSTSPKIVESN